MGQRVTMMLDLSLACVTRVLLGTVHTVKILMNARRQILCFVIRMHSVKTHTLHTTASATPVSMEMALIAKILMNVCLVFIIVIATVFVLITMVSLIAVVKTVLLEMAPYVLI